MFASMFKTLLNKSGIKKKSIAAESEIVKIISKDVEHMLTELDEIKDNDDNDDNCSVTKDDVTDAIESLSIVDNHPENFNDDASVDNFDDTKSEVSSIGENQIDIVTVEDPTKKKTMNQINSLQCLFTWNVKSKNKKNLILHIRNKYGEYNLNISSTEFTLERFIGNLIISYELFHNGEPELAQMKILEIGKWLEELDKGTDEFYLSIKIGLQRVMKATFIHMLFATNLTGECKWLLDDIVLFSIMDSKSRASVHAIRAAVLIEYGGNLNYLKKACEMAKKACDLDPKTSYWFYIHSLALAAQRQFLQPYRSIPTEKEINAINQANTLFNGINTLFKYHEMVLFRETTVGNYHNNKNKNDKFLNKNNFQDNKKIINMIETLIHMDPKDPLLVVKCAKVIMTLPTMVRDFNLAKQYLTKAFEMAPSDAAVLRAIENTVQAYKDISKTQKLRNNETKQNQLPPLKKKKSKLEIDFEFIVKKQKNGEDPIPYLTNLIPKYDGLDKSKIIAQLCSYTILFTNNLRSGVEEFNKLIELPGTTNNDIITKHTSLFGSKRFNLSELISNEIRLATNLNGTSPDDMLYYYKMLAKIMETCNLKIKDVDSSMKSKLIVNLNVKSKFSSTSVPSETEFSDGENIDKNITKQKHKAKHLQKKGPKVFTNSVKSNKLAKITDDDPKKNKNTSKKAENNKPRPKAYDVNQMKVKMEKVLNSSKGGNGNGFDSKSKVLTMENLGKSLEKNSEIHRYTQQFYQNILATTQSRFNSPNVSSGELNSYFNQNHANFSLPSSSNLLQNSPNIPQLLSLRPQKGPQDSNSKPKTSSIKSNFKK
ncbi:uncharacterized protein LOC112596062 [Melanaphis sacchari]|uniref:uncharacterized protein LOC112596062 n=1 Tax=Melanaphis sacchari TaxID=742174 RepID=UPI000DC144FB|nr:uncharacterized protein LOC112596062 [Melanaphis sacchari]